MNLLSCVLLFVVVVAFAVALRYAFSLARAEGAAVAVIVKNARPECATQVDGVECCVTLLSTVVVIDSHVI